MSNVKLDLSKFKHISSDGKTTKLRHEDGHFLVLSHKALGKDNQKALGALSGLAEDASQKVDQKMAEGGTTKVKMPAQQDPAPQNPPKDHDKEMMNNAGSGASSISDAMNKLAHPWAEGGKVQQYAEGTPDAPVRDISNVPDEEIANQPALEENEQLIDKQVPQQAQQAALQPVQQEVSKEEHNPDLLSHISYLTGKFGADAVKNMLSKKLAAPIAAYKLASKVGEGVVSGLAGEKEPQTNQSKAASQAAQGQMQPQQPPAAIPEQQNPPTQPVPPSTEVVQETQQAQGSPTLSADISATNNPMGMAQQGYANQIQGERNKAAALGEQGTAEGAALAKDAEAKQNAYNNFQKTYEVLNKERLAHVQDIQNGHIDPNAYWKDHSKVASAIGMIIAGFNPTTKPNAAIDFLRYQMDKNIESQKANLQSKNNLLQANLQQFHNLDAATNMTRIMQNDVITNQLQQAAAKAKTPMAQAAAQQAIGQIQMESAQRFRQLAMQQAMMATAGKGDPQSEAEFKSMTSMMRMMGMGDMAKDMEAKRIPGVGTASREVPSEVLKEITAHKAVNDLMNMSLQFSQQHRGLMDKLNPAEIAKAHTIQGQLIGAIKQAQHDGVYKPSEAEFLTSQIGGSPAAFMSKMSSEPKIKQLQAVKQNEYNQLLAPYGIKPQPLPQQQGPQIKTVGGVKYMRGPNGEAIPVK